MDHDNLRWGVDEVSKERESLKEPMREHLHIAVPHAPQEIKEQDMAIDQASRASSQQAGTKEGGTHHHTQPEVLQRCGKSSCTTSEQTKADSSAPFNPIWMS